MSFSWKDTVATISMVLVILLATLLFIGAFDGIEARWALGTFALFLIGGATGLMTGTARMMERTWSSLSLYLLSVGALVITFVNAFLNSGAWFAAMVVAYALIWIEFVGIDLVVHGPQDTTGLSAGGVR